MFHGVDIFLFYKILFYFLFFKAFAWFENKSIGQRLNRKLIRKVSWGWEGKTGVGPTNGEPKLNIFVLPCSFFCRFNFLFIFNKSCADTTNATIYPCDELWLVVSLYKNISLLIITHYII